MENVHANSILKNKISEMKNFVEKLNMNESSEQLSVLFWQIERLANQTREYLKVLNISEDFKVLDLIE